MIGASVSANVNINADYFRDRPCFEGKKQLHPFFFCCSERFFDELRV